MNLGTALAGAFSGSQQAYTQGQQQGQTYRANEQQMEQSAGTYADQRKLMAEQIKGAQQSNKANGMAIQQAEFEKQQNDKKWSQYHAGEAQSAINQNMKSITRGALPDVNHLNKQVSNSPEFVEMFGNSFNLANSQNPEEYKLVKDMLTGGSDTEDPYIDEKVKALMSKGMVLMGSVGGSKYPIDYSTLAAYSGSGMSPEDREIWDMDQMGVLDTKSYMALKGGQGGLSEIDKLAALNAKGTNLNMSERLEKDVLEKELKINKEQAVGRLTGQFSKDYRANLANNLVSDDAMVDEMLKNERLSGMNLSVENEKNSYGKLGLLKQSRELVGKLENFDNEELMTGKIDTAVKEVYSKIGDEDFAKLSKPEQLKVLNSVAVASGAGTLFADYVKLMSGAAVSDEEYQRLANIFYGGTPGEINIQTMTQAINEFANSLETSVEGTVSSLANKHPGYMGDVQRSLNNIRTGTSGEKIVQSRGSGNKTMSVEGAAEHVVESATSTVDSLWPAVKKMLGIGGIPTVVTPTKVEDNIKNGRPSAW